MNIWKATLLVFVVLSVSAFFALDLQQYLTLDNLKARQADIDQYRQARPMAALAWYAALYIAVTALSLPGATILTLAGGAVFGMFWGSLIVSFASSLGATLAFLVARFLLRDWVKSRFGEHARVIDDGMNRDGAFYLFTLRLVPVFPFFMINLLMGLTSIRVRTYYWVSQVGMLAGTLVYVNAGTQLAKIDSLADIVSPALLGSFALLGLFPWAARKTLDYFNQRKIYANWPKPGRFDANLVVIGAGAGGLVAAHIAAALKAKVTLIEKHKMGGDCLNSGCIPSKALIRTAKLLSQLKRARAFGIANAETEFDFAAAMERVQQVIASVAPHDSIERYTELGVEVIAGEAKIVSPWQVAVTGANGVKTITSRAIVIAAGARPFVPPIPGLDSVAYLTSDTIWRLRELPGRLLVLGGGPLGCELAQTFARLGSKVTLVEMAPRIMAREDAEVSDLIQASFLAEHIAVKTKHTAKEFIVANGQHILRAEHEGQIDEIPFDRVLIAIGRIANVQGYGVDELGITLSPRGTLQTNAFQETNYPNIFAVGDVAGPYQFTHTAAHQGWHAAVNAMFGHVKKLGTDYSVVPWATFTDPEVARVGLNEQDAQAQNVAYEISSFDMADLDRAIADGATQGFIKVLTVPGKDKILGVSIVGEHAADMIAEFVLAMKYGMGLNKILATMHIYPTMAEANKYVAGVWKRNHAPKMLLACLGRYHGWRRG
ncbi:dihydrolipoyl dehydrogenase [Methylomonas sp. SURF-2]|uniref:Dihydrolipoyl dehydrogenase n=1 Tax=Methylomonas subterranea TaxID=2952225 RepID=A0ABT1TK10_9GAMM|nr:dihydrolipoyl dehydrogenase [Methylomonas sp. SURF-2]MCQ8105654.1 dihydrolipoyl dehydrogenase [Methylomonas sp. SURF-2]